MSIAYTELQSAVVGQLEIDATDGDRFELDANLATAQLGIINALPFEYLKNCITTTKFNVASGTHLYQWPDDFVRFVALWVDFASTINEASGVYGNKCISPNDETAHLKNFAALATKRYPVVDLNVEGGFGIYPVPDANVTDGFRLRYIWRVPNPTSTQDCLLEYNLRNLMIYKATQLCAMVDEFNIQLAGEMGKAYADELAKFLPKKDKR